MFDLLFYWHKINTVVVQIFIYRFSLVTKWEESFHWMHLNKNNLRIMEVLHVDTRKNFKWTLNYVKKARAKVAKESFKASDFIERGLKAQGFKLSPKEVESVEVEKPQEK